MKKFFPCLIFLCMVFTQNAIAQETTVQETAEQEMPAQEKERLNRIGISIGGSFGGYREETDSSINRYYNHLSYFLDADFERKNFLHNINLGFFMGENTVARKFEEKYSPLRYYSIRANIEYALDYRLWGNETFPGYFGGSFRTDAYVMTETMEIAKITALFSLGAHVTQKYIINSRHSLVLTAGMPLLGYAVRPPYPGVDEILEKHTSEGNPIKIFGLGKFSSIHNYWALFADLKYHFKLIDLLSLNVGLGFDLSRVNFPQPRIDAVFRLSGGISFTF